MFEQVKDYKSACAILGKKPIDKRRKLDEHIWYSWWYIDWDKIEKGSYAGLFNLDSNLGVSSAYADVGNHLQFINRDAAEYAAKTFKPLYMKYIFGID